MDERMRFVIRLKDGETMASLCREFGISRKTGYKIFERYQQCGLEGLSDRVRRPFRYANQLPAQVEAAIVSAKREKPHWGARKIRERLLRRLPHAIKTPAASTIHAVLDRHGLVKPMGRRRSRAEGTPLSDGLLPAVGPHSLHGLRHDLQSPNSMRLNVADRCNEYTPERPALRSYTSGNPCGPDDTFEQIRPRSEEKTLETPRVF